LFTKKFKKFFSKKNEKKFFFLFWRNADKIFVFGHLNPNLIGQLRRQMEKKMKKKAKKKEKTKLFFGNRKKLLYIPFVLSRSFIPPCLKSCHEHSVHRAVTAVPNIRNGMFLFFFRFRKIRLKLAFQQS